MADNNELTRKEKRQQRQADKASRQVAGQAQKYGIDLDKLPTGPVTEGVKQKITEGIKKTVPKEIMSDVEGFSETYTTPQFETTPTLDKERLEESARKQRKARFADALTAFGAGLRGQTLPQEMLRSRQLERERDTEFQTYKDVVQRNKQTQMAWEQQYRNDLINFAQQKAKDKTLSPVEQKKYEQMAAQLKLQKDKFDKEYGTGGFREREIALGERRAALGESELKARKEGKYYDSGSTNTEDPGYKLKRDQYLLDLRQQEGKEAAEKLENTIKGYEADIANLQEKRIKLEQQQKDAKRRDRDSFDTLIEEVDTQIAAVNQQIADAFKSAPAQKSKLDEFFE